MTIFLVCVKIIGGSYIVSRTIQTVVYVGQQIRLKKTTYFFIKDHLWSWQNHPDDKLVIFARQVVLLTQMAKLCLAIRPPCGANKPPPAEGSLCLDTPDFTPDIRRLQQLVVHLRHKVWLNSRNKTQSTLVKMQHTLTLLEKG